MLFLGFRDLSDLLDYCRTAYRSLNHRPDVFLFMHRDRDEYAGHVLKVHLQIHLPEIVAYWRLTGGRFSISDADAMAKDQKTIRDHFINLLRRRGFSTPVDALICYPKHTHLVEAEPAFELSDKGKFKWDRALQAEPAVATPAETK